MQNSFNHSGQNLACDTGGTGGGQSQSEAIFNAPYSTINAGRDNNFYIVAGNMMASKESILIHLKTALNPITTARHDAYESRKRETCFPNTRVQVLNDIESWLTSEGQCATIYVLEGVAGIGKSTVAQTVAIQAAQRGLLGASFFFSRDEDARMVAKYFFPTIAYQFSCYDEQSAPCISQALEEDPEAPGKRLYQQFTSLLEKPLRDLYSRRAKPTLMVVDALDECEESGGQELLEVLGRYAHQISGLKILITTRPERHLRHIFNQDENHKHFRLHDIEHSVVHADIRLYLHSRLSVDEIRKVFRNLRKPWQPSDSDMDILCGICGTLFIIAATAVKFILDSKFSPQTRFSYLLKGVSLDDFTGSKHTDVLDTTYLRIIFATQSELNEIDEDWFRSINNILGALIALSSPLSCEALASILEIDPDDLEACLSDLHSLVAPSGNGAEMIFRIHHKSFPDFITNKGRIQRALRNWNLTRHPEIVNLLWVDIDDHHLQLAKACFRVMDSQMKWNMANINETDWYKDKEDLAHVASSLVSHELVYAALHWASHLQTSGRIGTDTELQNYLDTWVSKHILFWLEVMSILDRVGGAYTILQVAVASVKNSIGKAALWPHRAKVEDLLSDASRFVQQGSELMKLSPIHIYRSCLPFVPSETALYRAYGTMAMSKVGMKWKTQWGPLLATCFYTSPLIFSVESVAFSNDGSQLASGFSDHSIQIWDGKSGVHVQTLTGHSEGVTSVVFSSDGLHLASGSIDGTVRLWDTRTGAHIQTFTGYSAQVVSVEFSSDGSRLASRSTDKTIRLWDVETGEHVITLTNPESDDSQIMDLHQWGAPRGFYSRSITFSSDGSQLASGSLKNTIHIWDINTGAQVHTVTGHSARVNSVMFSNDGSQLASGSDDGTIQLWDASSFAHILTLTGHWDTVGSVAFSSDSLLLASGSRDYTIQLWDAKTGAHIFTLLADHSSEVFSVAFSNDGSRLASGSDKVQLWDTSLCIYNFSKPPLTEHIAQVLSVAFSDDGSQLASGSLDTTVRIWNAKTGVHISTLTGHINGVSSVIFSADGSRLASGSLDLTIRVWDVENYAHILTLTCDTDSIESIAFSKDGSRLASGFHDGIIQVWDAMTGVHISTLSCSSHQPSHRVVEFVGFLSDSSQLVSGSWDKIVRLWDIETGVQIRTLADHTDYPWDFFPMIKAFSSEDALLITTTDMSNIHLWDTMTGTRISTLDGPTYSLRDLIAVAILPCKGGVGNADHTSLLLLVKRNKHLVTGLVRATLLSGDARDIEPLCWFPPDMNPYKFAFDRSQYQVALISEDGHIVLIDFSSEKFRFT